MFLKRNISFSETDFDSIVAACIKNDSRAQRELFKQFFGYGKSIALRYSSNNEEAEEILNESFLKIFQNLERYDTRQPFKAWFRTTLVNTAISYYRKNQKYANDISFDDIQEPNFDESAIDKLAAEEILVVVQRLPDHFRNVFVMYAVDGYSHKEIAEILNMNEATVRSNFARAKAKLQQFLMNTHPHLFPASFDAKLIKLNEN